MALNQRRRSEPPSLHQTQHAQGGAISLRTSLATHLAQAIHHCVEATRRQLNFFKTRKEKRQSLGEEEDHLPKPKLAVVDAKYALEKEVSLLLTGSISQRIHPWFKSMLRCSSGTSVVLRRPYTNCER
ncbi:uncharacterized protein LOC121810061 [Salvia splendens]|uniref:uncharacterized protein LOC121810061 n=1 Tax=Salvia splendens TaxID=180675 RepID=UPI001C26228A|nr:uncharacterized protein LOC121810061 [Salvia splendens]